MTNKYPNLQASASDLLEALDAILNSPMKYNVMSGYMDKEWAAGEAAIEKAKQAQGGLNISWVASYPHAPAEGKTDTSREAAEKIRPKAGTLKAIVLTMLKERDLTVSELAGFSNKSRRGLQPRFTELMQTGWIKDSGKRRKNGQGNNEIVWTLVEKIK